MISGISFSKEIKLKNGQVLLLREPMEKDATKMIAYCNVVGGESDNLSFGEDQFHLTVEEEVEYIKISKESDNIFMIIGLIDDKIVTLAQINSPSKKRITHNSELSISVLKEYWRNGIGIAVMDELIKFAKEHKVIKNISLGVKASNRNAISLYEKFGFEKVGVHKNFFHVNGNFDDEILMDLYL